MLARRPATTVHWLDVPNGLLLSHVLALKGSGSSSVGGGSGVTLSADREGMMVPDDGEWLGVGGVGVGGRGPTTKSCMAAH